MAVMWWMPSSFMPLRLLAGGRLLGPLAGEPDHPPPGGRPVLHRDPLAHRVELVAAGEEVRRRQAASAQDRAVGTAADRLVDRLDALGADRALGGGRHLRVRLDVAAHVRVLVLRRELEPGAR